MSISVADGVGTTLGTTTLGTTAHGILGTPVGITHIVIAGDGTSAGDGEDSTPAGDGATTRGIMTGTGLPAIGEDGMEADGTATSTGRTTAINTPAVGEAVPVAAT